MSRAVACAAALLIAVACSNGPGPTSSHGNNTLRIAIGADVETFDPSAIHQPSVDVSLARNLFGGLYRFDDDLREVPDIATRMPDVSPDLMTWTFHLNPAAMFWNGDRVTAEDVVFSWNRAAARHNDDAFVFQPIEGFDALQAGTATTLSGLSVRDDRTLTAKLSAPFGAWLVELGLWPAAVLDQKVIKAEGDERWWTTPAGLVGTGPFRLSAWDHGHSLDFVPVTHWWRGATGALKRVHAAIIPNLADQVAAYERDEVDAVGYAPPSSSVPGPGMDAVLKYRQPKLKSQLIERPWLKTMFLWFNVQSGPLAGTAARDGREALSRAINRQAYADTACDKGTSCLPATQGVIVPGLGGALAPRQDPGAAFDPTAARALWQRWDPDGTRAARLQVTVTPHLEPDAKLVVQQWKQNLGVDIPYKVVDQQAFPAAIKSGAVMYINGFLADYDSPQDWFNGLIRRGALTDSEAQALWTAAAGKLPNDALPLYTRANQLLAADFSIATLAYVDGSILVKPQVHGAGGNALYEYYWVGISVG